MEGFSNTNLVRWFCDLTQQFIFYHNIDCENVHVMHGYWRVDRIYPLVYIFYYECDIRCFLFVRIFQSATSLNTMINVQQKLFNVACQMCKDDPCFLHSWKQKRRSRSKYFFKDFFFTFIPPIVELSLGFQRNVLIRKIICLHLLNWIKPQSNIAPDWQTTPACETYKYMFFYFTR